MTSTGRKKDPIWKFFMEVKNPNLKTKQARCIKCEKTMAALTQRMNAHHIECSNTDKLDPDVEEIYVNDNPGSKANNNETGSKKKSQAVVKNQTQPKMTNFLNKMSPADKKKIDLQLARCVFSTNVAHRFVDNSHFSKFVSMLNPSYKAPCRQTVSGSLLNEIYDEENMKAKILLENQPVSICFDGWKNISKHPVVASCIVKDDGSTFLVDGIDVLGIQQTSDNLQLVNQNAITKAEQKYSCKVVSLVTDSCNTMIKMRSNLANSSDDIISYGCSAHALNLLYSEICGLNDFSNTIDKVLEVVKYFRNHNIPRFWYESAGGSALVMPSVVRWNYHSDCLAAYLKNWTILAKICDDYKKYKNFNSQIGDIVLDMRVKADAEDILQILRPISVILDRLQSDTCKIADSVCAWKWLKEQLIIAFDTTQCWTHYRESIMTSFIYRYNLTITDAHLASFDLSPTHQMCLPFTCRLDEDEKERSLDYVEQHFPLNFISTYAKFKSQSRPFRPSMFQSHVISDITDYGWWKNVTSLFPQQIPPAALTKISQLMTAVASSAPIERTFSAFGLLHTKIRNRLGIDKCNKLVFVQQRLREKHDTNSDSDSD